MPEPDDFEKIDQIVEIARILSRIPTGNPAKPYMGTPAPIRASWATELYEDFGLRVHPDLAKKEMVRVQTPMGNNGPVQSVTKGTPARGGGADPMVTAMKQAHVVLMEYLRETDPVMAQRVAEAQTDPTKGAIVLNDIARNHPEIKAKIEELQQQYAAKAAAEQ